MFKNNNLIKNPTYLVAKSVDNSYKVSIRTMLSSVKNGADAMIVAKQTFLKFCDHFSKLQYPNLQNDHEVIKFFINISNNQDYLCNRAFQLALDVTYAKSSFDYKTVLENFTTYCNINNNGLSENSPVDQSTLFTLLQTTIMKKLYPSAEFTVNQTPPSNVNIKDASEKVRKILEENLQLTGNRFPDVHINNMPYDYKFIKDPSSTKNQIYLMPELPEAFNRFSNHLKILFTFYQTDKRIPDNFKQFMLSKILKTQELYKHAIVTKDKKEIINDWNDFIMNKAIPRPHDVGIAIFAVGKDPLELSAETIANTENIPLAEGRLDQIKANFALKAIIGTYEAPLIKKIHEATKGAFGHIINVNDEVP